MATNDLRMAIVEALDELHRYERSFDSVLVGENTVVALPGGFLRTIDGEPRVGSLPRATMYDPLSAARVAAGVFNGAGVRGRPLNYRAAIDQERQRLDRLLSMLG